MRKGHFFSMGTKQRRTPVKLSVAPWKLTLPGKILAICICLLPFLTRSFAVTLPEAVKKAYFLAGSQVYSDFEQYCRQLGLIVIAVAALAWFCYERATLRPRREMKINRMTIAILVCLGIYLLLGLLSTIFSAYPSESWLGIYQMYEGYLALLSYAILFAAAWYWVDREEIVQFVKKCLTVLSIVLGILALLEQSGISYYNTALVQLFGNLGGTVGLDDAIFLTFGNADYLGMYCAMLLPVMVSMISRKVTTPQMLAQIVAAVLLAATLILSKVTNAILLGFGMSAIFLLVWMFHGNWKRIAKLSVTGFAVVAVIAGGTGFLMSRNGDSMSQKLEHAFVGMAQEETFQLLTMDVDGNTVVFENEDTTFSVTADDATLSTDHLTFTCNGTEVAPQVDTNLLCSFTEPELQHCQIQITADRLQFQLGYQTPVETIRTADGWQVVGIGGTILDDVKQVSDSKTIQKIAPYLNGRVFVWANTISVLKDCWLLGHGPSTAIFYLNQNDLPALLNIFSTYALYNKPHNWYLQIAQDTGILSLVAILIMMTLFLIKGCRSCFGKKAKWEPFRTGLLFAVMTCCLLALFNDSLVYHAPMFWFLFGMGWRMMQTEEPEVQTKSKEK